MNNLIKKIEEKNLKTYIEGKKIDQFRAGDSVCVKIKIQDGQSVRIQAYEGVVIAKKGGIMSSGFTVRKNSGNISTEKSFSIHSPLVDSVTLVRKGKVRRAKLYYLRDKKGKAARIKERKEY